MFFNALPFMYFIILMFAAVGWRAYRVWSISGVNALSAYRVDGVYGVASTLIRLVFVGYGLVTLANLFAPSNRYLVPISWLERPGFAFFGWVLLAVALVLIVVAQIHMGAAWRIGVDASQTSQLVTEGIFHYSRNPIFLGMRLCFLGLFLVVPTTWTLMLWVMGDALIQIQVRLEEAHLTEVFGQKYRDYLGTVRRWI